MQPPVIDAAPLFQGLPADRTTWHRRTREVTATAEAIREAISVSGFFYIRNHGIPDAVINTLRMQQRAFFALPASTKNRIAIDQNSRGYLGHGQARMHGATHHDQKEVFFWGAELPENHADIVDGVPLCGLNQWPEQPAAFKQSVLTYATAIRELGDRLLAAIAYCLGSSPDFFLQHYTSPMLRGQLIHYPPTQGDEENFGVAPHTDFGCITLLLQELAGLEALLRNSAGPDIWTPVPPIENTLVINVGDLLEQWSGGRMPSTRHRVRNTSGVDRYSIAMFYDPDPRAVIDGRQLAADSTRFEPVRAADYILGRNRGAFAQYGEINAATNTER